MNILFVTPRLPYPPLKGDQLRAFYIIKHLHKRGHKISLLSFIENEREMAWRQKLMEYCEVVETVLLPKWKSYLNMIFGLFSKIPFQVKFYYSREMFDAVRDMSAKNSCDVVHFIFSRMMSYAKVVERIPVVMDHVDAYSMNMERKFNRERGFRKAISYYEWKRMKRYERSNHSLFNYSVVASRIDREYLNNERIEIIPNGVDQERFAPVRRGKDIDLIFTGNMGYFPNKDAVLYFCQEIFPLILERRPESTFYIVGTDPSPKIRKLADGKNIFVTGYVNDMKDYLNRSLVSVCPIKAGSGIQNKVLEAMANVVPIVATSYAIGGISADNGKEVFIADKPEEFAENVLKLLGDKKLRERLSLNGRRLVEQEYSWDVSAVKFEDVYNMAQKAFIEAGTRLAKRDLQKRGHLIFR